MGDVFVRIDHNHWCTHSLQRDDGQHDEVDEQDRNHDESGSFRSKPTNLCVSNQPILMQFMKSLFEEEKTLFSK